MRRNACGSSCTGSDLTTLQMRQQILAEVPISNFCGNPFVVVEMLHPTEGQANVSKLIDAILQLR
jgi:hypothetical protein